MESTTRMVFADNGVLNHFTVTNQSDQPVTRTLEMNLQFGQAVQRPEPQIVVVPGGKPDVLFHTDSRSNHRHQWEHHRAVENFPAAHAGQEISYAMALEKPRKPPFKMRGAGAKILLLPSPPPSRVGSNAGRKCLPRATPPIPDRCQRWKRMTNR